MEKTVKFGFLKHEYIQLDEFIAKYEISRPISDDQLDVFAFSLKLCRFIDPIKRFFGQKMLFPLDLRVVALLCIQLYHAPELEAAIRKIIKSKNLNLPVDKDGNTVLHLAVKKEIIPLIMVLLDVGADVDAKNDRGFTALTLATLNGHTSTAQILLEAGTRST